MRKNPILHTFSLALILAFAATACSFAQTGKKPAVSPTPAMTTSASSIPESVLQDLIAKAKDASKHAYAPYSKFPVGAAVLTEDGHVYQGCNVENASYGLTICGERNAIFHMVEQGHQKIKAVAVYTPTPVPSPPCGACRQVINEFGPNALVVSVCDGPGVLKMTVEELLPHAFGPGNLE